MRDSSRYSHLEVTLFLDWLSNSGHVGEVWLWRSCSQAHCTHVMFLLFHQDPGFGFLVGHGMGGFGFLLFWQFCLLFGLSCPSRLV
jgi:hypothetical protein